MKIITCFKLVPKEQDVVAAPECTLNSDNADAKISQSGLNAIRAASQLATDGSEIAALIVDDLLSQNSKVRRDVLSRGPHSLYLMQDTQLEHALPLDTAKALAAAIERIDFNLLILDEGSDDLYAQQVGLPVGEILQLPVINAMSAIQCQSNILATEHTLGNNVEVIGFSVPVMLYVTSDINMSRIPSARTILGTSERPVNQWQASGINWNQSVPLAELVGIRVPPQTERGHTIIDNDSSEAIAELAEYLKKALN